VKLENEAGSEIFRIITLPTSESSFPFLTSHFQLEF